MKNKDIQLTKYRNNCINNINKLLHYNGWTIKKLAEKSKLPYESVKKFLSGKINNPSMYSLIKISEALGCGIDFLVKSDSTCNFDVSHLPRRAVTLIQEMANFESFLYLQNSNNNLEKIPVFVPTIDSQDGAVFDSVYYESIDVSSYRKAFGDIILCGIKIVGTKLHPAYLNGDIVLVARDRFPMNHEIAVFLKEHRVYIRKYVVNNPIQMESVNGSSKPLTIPNISDIHFFGRILTIVRQ